MQISILEVPKAGSKCKSCWHPSWPHSCYTGLEFNLSQDPKEHDGRDDLASERGPNDDYPQCKFVGQSDCPCPYGSCERTALAGNPSEEHEPPLVDSPDDEPEHDSDDDVMHEQTSADHDCPRCRFIGRPDCLCSPDCQHDCSGNYLEAMGSLIVGCLVYIRVIPRIARCIGDLGWACVVYIGFPALSCLAERDAIALTSQTTRQPFAIT